jgi:hypothetical protein
MSVYHNTNPYNKFTYYQTNIDKTIPNSIEKDRFFENVLNHSMTGKGSNRVPTPSYNFDIVKGIKRFGDERNRAEINRSQKAFLTDHSKFSKTRTYN